MGSQRRYSRCDLPGVAYIVQPDAAHRTEGRITSLGRGGLGLFTEGFWEVGQFLKIELHWTDHRGQPHQDRLEGTVVSAQVNLEGNTLGIQFIRPLDHTHQDLLDWIDRDQDA